MNDKERTISNLRKLKSFHNGSYGTDIDRAIKVLEQESVLDKIKTDISEQSKMHMDGDLYIKTSCCMQIINKYKSESEED